MTTLLNFFEKTKLNQVADMDIEMYVCMVRKGTAHNESCCTRGAKMRFSDIFLLIALL